MWSKQAPVTLPDQVSGCHDQPNPLEVQPYELERHKQESEDQPKKSLEKER